MPRRSLLGIFHLRTERPASHSNNRRSKSQASRSHRRHRRSSIRTWISDVIDFFTPVWPGQERRGAHKHGGRRNNDSGRSEKRGDRNSNDRKSAHSRGSNKSSSGRYPLSYDQSNQHSSHNGGHGTSKRQHGRKSSYSTRRY